MTDSEMIGDTPTAVSSDVEKNQKPEKHVRTGDKDNEELLIPKNRIIVVFIGLMLSTFLAALDQTIVCMSPPWMWFTQRLPYPRSLPI
jgi:hypothetical protein